MARSLWKPIHISKLNIHGLKKYWSTYPDSEVFLYNLRDVIHSVYFLKRLKFFFNKRGKYTEPSKLYLHYIQIGMKFGMLCPYTTAGGYRCAVDEKKREKWQKDVDKYKRKQQHLEREKSRLEKKVAKEEKSAARKKRKQK